MCKGSIRSFQTDNYRPFSLVNKTRRDEEFTLNSTSVVFQCQCNIFEFFVNIIYRFADKAEVEGRNDATEARCEGMGSVMTSIPNSWVVNCQSD